MEQIQTSSISHTCNKPTCYYCQEMRRIEKLPKQNFRKFMRQMGLYFEYIPKKPYISK